MADPTLVDTVGETTTTTGTGTVTLAGAITNYLGFTDGGVANGDTVDYSIRHQSAEEFETGQGVYDSGAGTLTRVTIYQSSNSGSAVNFSAGTKNVYLVISSNRLDKVNAGSWSSVCNSGSSDQTYSTTSVADVTGMTLAVEANSIYYFRFIIRWNRTGTGAGPSWTVTVPASATPTAIVQFSHAGDGSSGAYHGRITSGGDEVKSTTSSGEDTIATVEGFVETAGTAGNIQLQAANQAGTGPVTVYKRSFGYCYKVA